MARNINNKRRGNDGGKNLLYIALGVAAVAIVAAFLLWPSKKHYINDERGVVRSVVDNSTIELANGLKVNLLGVEPTEKSGDFLKSLIGKEVRLTVDSSNPKKYYEDASKETVKAYVTLTQPAEYSNLNGHLSISA